VTDDEYQKEKANLEKFLIPLKDALLNDWKIKHVFNRERDDDGFRMADTSALWQYKTATINWYMPAVKQFCPEQSDVFNLVIHEFTHCIIDPITPDIEKASEEQIALVEFVTQTIADSMQRLFTSPSLILDYEKRAAREKRKKSAKK
jgi:primase-polymerase (primpol)-like protein